MKRFHSIFTLLIALLLTTNACQNMDKKNTTEFKIDFQKYQLENGLQVVLHEDHSDPIVSVAILFHVGSNREVPGRTGFAHFFEHMLFQNSENVGKGNFFRKIEELGGTLNGGTWQDGTIYYEVFPKDALEKVLWMESDRMGYMINTVTVPVLENEKQVVKNEKRQRVDNQPYGHTSYVIDKALYPEGHPYNWQVIGSLEDLEAATIDDVKTFYGTYYGPNNATVVLAGDITPEEVKPLIEKYFGEIQAKPDVPTIKPQPGQVTENIRLVHEDNFAKLPELTMVFPSVEDGHPDSYALDYLGAILSDGKRAPLYKEIVEEKKLAPRVGAYNSTGEIAGKFMIRIRANENTDLDSVYQGVMNAFQQFEQNGIDDRDMERIKSSQEIAFYDGISSVLSKSFQLAQFNTFRGDPGLLEQEIQKILGVTKEDITRVYNQYLKNKPFIATSFVPKGQLDLALANSQTAEVVEEPIVEGAENAPMAEDEVAFDKTPSQFDRSIEPELGASPDFTVPNIWNEEMPDGLLVYGIENTELPLVEFSLRIKGGMLLDDPNKIGVANLMTDIMMEGTQNKTPEELQDAIGLLGSNISMYTNSEYIELSGNSLTRNFDQTMALVQEILLQPRWDEKEFERLKQKTITDIQQRSAQPNAIASNVFNKLVYGPNHILSNSSLGTEATVASITLDDLKTFYANYFAPNISTMHIAGSVTRDEVKKALAGMVSNWKEKEVAVPEYTAQSAPDHPSLYFVDVPNSKQSVVSVGTIAMKASNDDYFMADLVNYKLGGSFNSQLNMTLREEKGYTYGARSQFTRRQNEGAFIANSSVRSNVTKESVDIFKDIIDNYGQNFSQEDLDKTKQTYSKSNARAFETLAQKMNMLENISTFDLPSDYVVRQQEKMKALTLPEAQGLIKKYIDPNKMVYVIIGDAATQMDRLNACGLGQPIQLDRDAVPVSQVLN